MISLVDAKLEEPAISDADRATYQQLKTFFEQGPTTKELFDYLSDRIRTKSGPGMSRNHDCVWLCIAPMALILTLSLVALASYSLVVGRTKVWSTSSD
jgi:hypothetical protein